MIAEVHNRGYCCCVYREQALARIQKRCEALSSMTQNGSRNTLGDVPPLVVFPEGTTTSGSTLLPFRRGAFLPMQPVTPVGTSQFSRSNSNHQIYTFHIYISISLCITVSVLIYRCGHINVSFEILSTVSWLALTFISVIYIIKFYDNYFIASIFICFHR